MKVGMIGLGRVGLNMSRLLRKQEIMVWGYRRDYEKAQEAYENDFVDGVTTGIKELVQQVKTGWGMYDNPGTGVFMMAIPAETVEETLNELLLHCGDGDIIIDCSDSNFKDSKRRAECLSKLGIQYIDCGTSGGVHGMERGYCLMVGGTSTTVSACAPIFRALSPGIASAPRTDPYEGATSAEYGWLHCGPPGAGHFVKMIHNGIEYGIMQAYAEGFEILDSANLGKSYVEGAGAKAAPMADPENYCYDINVGEVAELWRRGSIISSWLLDLTANVLRSNPTLDKFDTSVSDSGEGRWTVNTAVDLSVPAPVISNALYARFNSRGLGSTGNRILSAMRFMFGGHV